MRNKKSLSRYYNNNNMMLINNIVIVLLLTITSLSVLWNHQKPTNNYEVYAQREIVSLGKRLITNNQSGSSTTTPFRAASIYNDNKTTNDDIILDDEANIGSHHDSSSTHSKTKHKAFDTIDISFEGIELILSTKKGDKVILDGSIRGRAKPGSMLAIMGPSGAGKSSIIHALAGRIKSNNKIQLYGTRYMNGIPISGDSMIHVAFIEQEVNFFPYMTVRETISFRVELKLGSTIKKKSDRDDIVINLINQMGLQSSADTIVGNQKVRGISGGEKKRLSIAIELISSPPIILLDEPTSGLDSTAATSLIETLHELAITYKKTIIAVIHQPNQRVFNKFDNILLVSEGKQMYYGKRSNVRSYMEKHGYKAPPEMGTAEHILDCITNLPFENETLDDAKARIERLASVSRNVDIDLGIDQHKKVLLSHANKPTKLKRFLLKNQFLNGPRSNIFIQFRLLLNRSFREVFRGKSTILLKLVQQITTGSIYGGIYKIGNNQASIMDRYGLLNLIIIGTTNLALSQTIRSFPREKIIVSNELSSKMYRTLPYFIAKAISEIPMSAILNGIFGVLVYKLTGLNVAVNKFRNFIGMLILHGIVTEAAGLFIGAISSSTDMALAAFPAIVVLSIIFDGRNISEENTPKFLRWISKVGLVRWGYEGLCINEFTGLQFDTPNAVGALIRAGPPIIKTGKDALARFGMDQRTVRDIIGYQIRLASSFWLLSYLGLTLTKQKYTIMQPPLLSNDDDDDDDEDVDDSVVEE